MNRPKKLDIYDKPISQSMLVNKDIPFESLITDARLYTTAYFATVHNKVQSYVDGWISIEKQLSSKITSFIDKDDHLLPNALFVAVATFSGSILARNRGISSRILIPTTLAMSSFAFMYPKTSDILMREFTSIPPFFNTARKQIDTFVESLQK